MNNENIYDQLLNESGKFDSMALLKEQSEKLDEGLLQGAKQFAQGAVKAVGNAANNIKNQATNAISNVKANMMNNKMYSGDPAQMEKAANKAMQHALKLLISVQNDAAANIQNSNANKDNNKANANNQKQDLKNKTQATDANTKGKKNGAADIESSQAYSDGVQSGMRTANGENV